MIGRTLNAYRVELIKAFRYKATYIGPVLMLLLVLASPIVHPLLHDERSDYDFIAYTAPLAVNLLGFVLILSYCANLVASELATGTIRLVFVRPIRRTEFLFAKLLIGLTYALTLTCIATVATWSLALIFGDLDGVRFGADTLFTDRDMRIAYLTASALSLFPQWAAASYALFLSTCIRSASASTMTAIGLWILVDMVKYPLEIAPFVFTSYMETSWQGFTERCMGLETGYSFSMLHGAGVCLVSMIVFTSAAATILERRDISS